MIQQQVLLGLVLMILALVDAQDHFTLNIDQKPAGPVNDENWTLQPRNKNDWTIEPRASGTVSCARRPKIVTLNPGDVATFNSPGYPNYYDSRTKCGWKFKASQSSGRITITCSSFNLQPAVRNRCRDYLKLGRRKYCGNAAPTVTTGNSLKILFKTDRTSNWRGFKCTASVDGTVVTTTSPSVTTTAPPPSGRCVCGKANRATRIVGGVTTEVNEYPWQVALVGQGSSQVFCGGSLINDRWVLTAAHCTASGVSQVLLGNHLQSQTDSNEKRINVRRVVDHPNYNSRTLNNDFSLLELSEAVDLESVAPAIRPVCLPSASNPSQYENVPSIVSGWGTTSSGGSQPNALREVTVKTMTNSACNGKYGSGTITSAMICAANPNKDSCQGDSGGPLVRNVGGYFNLIGVVSWGYGCADSRYPGVYARVTNQIDWITRTSSSGNTCSPP